MSAFQNALGNAQQPTADPNKLSTQHMLQFSSLPGGLAGYDFSGGPDFSKPGLLGQMPNIDYSQLTYNAPLPTAAAAPAPAENLPQTPIDRMNAQMKDILRRQQAGEIGFPGGDVESLYAAHIPDYHAFMGRKAPGSDAGP